MIFYPYRDILPIPDIVYELLILPSTSWYNLSTTNKTTVLYFSPSPSYGSHGCQEKEEVPTPLKPDPLGLESSLPFKGPLSSRSTTKLKPVPFNEQEHNEDDYDDQDCKRLEEEFEAEYDYPSQEEEQTYGRIEQQPAETTDSGNEISSNSDSEGENDYHSTVHQEESSHRGKKRHTSIPQEEESLLRAKKMRTSIPQQEESSPRGKKRHTSIPQEEESLLRTKKMRTSIPQQEESSPRGKKRCHEEREEEEGEVSDDGDGSQSQVITYREFIIFLNRAAMYDNVFIYMLHFSSLEMPPRLLPSITLWPNPILSLGIR